LPLLAKLRERSYTVESRMMLTVRVLRDGKTVYEDLALNDAVITKGAVARIIDLAVYGDDMLISNFSGDGIIVCTPTGSTAYSMSAGGPIVEPTAENIIVTPICAHALHVRPMVLGQDRVVAAKMGRLSRKTAYLSVDGGKAVKLGGGDAVEIRKAQAKTLLVRLTGRSFYEIMNQKLGNG
ncbi:MAG: NAD(+)/NADH kinase, partial [Pseudoflavonifractor sp.]